LKKVLIIYPHFPPSNLVGVHRTRLFAQHLPSFGWEPIILTVHEKFYEEKLDYNLVKLLPVDLRIEKVNAFKITKPRIVGDIGLRAFFQLYKKAKEIIKEENIDFLYISIASFYCSLLGRWLNNSTGIKYGIDYQDPWVHFFPGSEKIFSKHWFSTKLASFLEPIAVKNASLITGIDEAYYKPVFERNAHLKKIISGSIPMGGEKRDHEISEKYEIENYLFKKKENKLQFIYAGVMWSKAYQTLDKVFQAISISRSEFSNVEFHFIGTGSQLNVNKEFSINKMASKYELLNDIVFEYPQRIPYLDVLAHLNIADAVFIFGSTEPHYTPSKVYQAILSTKPIFSVLHENSSAVKIIKDSNAGCVLTFNGEDDLHKILNDFTIHFKIFKEFKNSFIKEQIKQSIFKEYSAYEVTKKLALLLNNVIINRLT
jgi:hypothetical protein